MVLTRRFDPKRMRGRLVGLVSAFLLLGVVATAVGDLPSDFKRRDQISGRGLTPAAGNVLSRHIMDRNRVIMLLTDVGEIGSSGSSVAGGGFWLATSNQYIFSSGPNVGAETPNGEIVVAIGGPFSELHFGSLVFPEFPNSSGLGHGVSSPGGVIWDSTIEDGLAMPDQCTVDAFRVAQFPSLQPFSGQPFPGFADQTVCMAVNDITGGTCGDCAGTRVGVEIIETMFAFGVPSVQDFVFVAFRIFNRTEFLNSTTAPAQPAGPYDLDNTIVAIAVDPDIGEAGDDQIAFLPDVQTMVFWDSDFSEPQFQGVPGFGGISYLKTPIDPLSGEEVGLQEFTAFTNGQPRPDPSSKEVWYALMTGDPTEAVLEVTPQDVRGMASSGQFTLPAGEFVEIYGAYFFANVSGSPPADLRAEAYKDQATGELDPDANQNAAFGNFRLVQQTAQATFDAGFVVPTSPPKPNFTLIPGDRQVTVVWGNAAVSAVNAFAKVARDPFARLGDGSPDPDAPGTGVLLTDGQVVYVPALDQGGTTGFVTAGSAGLTGAEITNPAFNPDFVIQDFQGFNVYRSYSGLASDAELIAQYDLSDDIAGGVFCVAAVPVFSGDDFVTSVCTQQAELALGSNSGLSFSVVDRGGTFPDPADGPGLVNGIPVFYTVNAYGVNCGQSPVDLPSDEAFDALVPPASCLVLESGLAPFRSATPRSNATSLEFASGSFLPMSGDEICNPDQPPMTIDASTGAVTGYSNCSNAVRNVDLTIIRGTNVPTADFIFKIDSILPSPVNPYVGGYTLASGFATVWYHWEDADGNLATEITPTVGSYLSTHDFAAYHEDKVAFSIDTDPSDVGADAALSLTIGADFSATMDLVINGQSVSLGDFGGAGTGNLDGGPNGRAHVIDGSSIATRIVIGNPRGLTNSRAYTSAGPYAAGGHSFILTWSRSGNTFGGTMVRATDGAVVPEGGQPKGPANPSTPADFIVGYNWGFVKGATAAATRSAIFPVGGPLTNSMVLNQGDTFGIAVSGQSVYIEGIQDLPEDGDVWEIQIVPGWDRGIFHIFGRDPSTFDPAGPFVYHNDNGNEVEPGVLNVSPGLMWRLSLQGGTNELADADLSRISVVPNPFIAANEITRGRGLQRILFTNLPPQATIRIYTISGNLVRVLEHSDGSGTTEWDVRTRFDLLVASGNYYYHVTTPDGRQQLGRFAVIN